MRYVRIEIYNQQMCRQESARSKYLRFTVSKALNDVVAVQECDATMLNRITNAGNKKLIIENGQLIIINECFFKRNQKLQDQKIRNS
jgi:hypothetical protein